MYGPIGVEQVVHILSRETGFVTEVTPDLVVNVKDSVTNCILDTMLQMANETIGSMSFGEQLGVVGGTMAFGWTFGMVGMGIMALGGYKLIDWSQDRQPIVITPLTLGYKPLVAGLHGYKNDNFYVSLKGKLYKWWQDVESGWDKFWSSTVPDWAASHATDFVNDT
jgi:hypothetical protein